MAPEDAPATKRDIRELGERVTRLEERLGGVEEHLAGVDRRLGGVEGHLAGMEERLQERMRDMQTELLRALLPYQ